MRRTYCVHRPVIVLPVRDERSDADDRVVDVLRELIADRLADLYVGLADEVVGGREPAMIHFIFKSFLSSGPKIGLWLHLATRPCKSIAPEKRCQQSRYFCRCCFPFFQDRKLQSSSLC